MAPESTIVVERRKELTYLLCQGAELEYGLMCQYLYAAFSLKTSPGPGVRPDQLVAIERWRSVILDISREEMLHWSMVQNLLTAVGSAPFVSCPHMPHQAKGYPLGVRLRLLPFGEAALHHFVYLERPEGIKFSDAAGFEHDGQTLTPMTADEIVPRGQNCATQGDLYRSIGTGLVELARKFGEDQLLIGPVFHQTDEETIRWPHLPSMTSTARAALYSELSSTEKVTRGEWSTPHFGRFLDVLHEYQAMRSDDPHFESAHPAVEGIEPDLLITGLTSDLCNAIYELLLQIIARYIRRPTRFARPV